MAATTIDPSVPLKRIPCAYCDKPGEWLVLDNDGAFVRLCDEHRAGTGGT